MVHLAQLFCLIVQDPHVRGQPPPCTSLTLFARPEDLACAIRAIEVGRRERLFCGFGGGSHNEKIPRRLYFPGFGERLANLPN